VVDQAKTNAVLVSPAEIDASKNRTDAASPTSHRS